MDETIYKYLGLLLTSYWWFPVMRIVIDEARRVADSESGGAPRGQQLSAGLQRASEGWDASDAELRNPTNASWSIGRRPVQRRGVVFADNSKCGASLVSFNGPRRR